MTFASGAVPMTSKDQLQSAVEGEDLSRVRRIVRGLTWGLPVLAGIVALPVVAMSVNRVGIVHGQTAQRGEAVDRGGSSEIRLRQKRWSGRLEARV